MNNPGAKNSARSCLSCSKAKAKCVRRLGSSDCERCSRLKKECLIKEPVSRRKKQSKSTRTAQLEKLQCRIESLVDALSAQQNINAPGSSQPLPGSLDPSYPQESHQLAVSDTRDVLGQLCAELSENGSPSSEDTNFPADEENMQPELSYEEIETLLDRYQRLMAPNMPFVIIPENVTAREMQEQKPVLLLAITVTAMFHDYARQHIRMKMLAREIIERLIMRGEKSMDLLQGILVMGAWQHVQHTWSQQLNSFLHLAAALVIDMGIDRPPTINTDLKSATMKAVYGPNLVSKVHSLEERRALVGVFYSISILSTSLRRVDTMRFTSYMEDALNALEQAREYDSDLLLVQLVRTQCVIESINGTNAPNAPARVYINAIQADLDRIRRNNPYQNDNVLLRMGDLTAEAMMWELTLTELQDRRHGHLTSKMEGLYHCLTAVKALFETYFTVPASQYFLMPFAFFAQFAHMFICSTKLSTLEVEGWDLQAANEQVNLSQILAEGAHRFEHTVHCTPDGLTMNNDAISKWATKLQWIQHIYETKFLLRGGNAVALRDAAGSEAAIDVVSRPPTTVGSAKQQPTPPDDTMLPADFFDYLDENFWDHFTADFDFAAAGT